MLGRSKPQQRPGIISKFKHLAKTAPLAHKVIHMADASPAVPGRMWIGAAVTVATGLACRKPPKESALATPNYSYEKRQRELAKKRKNEEKRQRKLSGGGQGGQDEPDASSVDAPAAPADGEAAAEPSKG